MRLLLLFFSFLFPIASYAAGAIVPLPAIGSAAPPATFPDYIRYFFVAAIGLAGISALIMITIAGIQYSVSGVVDTKARAKAQITNALLGLALILFSYIFLRTINPDLVNLRLPSLTPAILQGKLPEYAPEGARVILSQKQQCAPGLEEVPKNNKQEAICVRTEESARLNAICRQEGRERYDANIGTCVSAPAKGTAAKDENAIEFDGGGTTPACPIANGKVAGCTPEATQAVNLGLGKFLSRDAYEGFTRFKQAFEDDCRRAIGETCTLGITSTTEPPKDPAKPEHTNPCHSLVGPTAGTCADIAIRTTSCEKVTPDCRLREEVIDRFHLTAAESPAILRCRDEYNGTSKLKNGDHFHCGFARIK